MFPGEKVSLATVRANRVLILTRRGTWKLLDVAMRSHAIFRAAGALS